MLKLVNIGQQLGGVGKLFLKWHLQVGTISIEVWWSSSAEQRQDFAFVVDFEAVAGWFVSAYKDSYVEFSENLPCHVFSEDETSAPERSKSAAYLLVWVVPKDLFKERLFWMQLVCVGDFLEIADF